MTTREDARDVGPALAPAERSAVAGIRGLRWWVVVLVAGVLAVAGVAADLLQAGELGIFYTICFPVGAVMASVWVRRGELFATCVQPPLLLAVSIPVAIAATGSLPRTGGLTATVLAVGGPMINGFPAMAITTAVCLAVAFVRSRLQPLDAPADDREPTARPGPSRADRDRTERRSDDRRGADRRPEERRGEPGRPSGRPAARPERATPARRPSGEADEPRAPGRERQDPGVFRVPRPPQASRPGARPVQDPPKRPPKRPPPQGT